MAKRKNELGLAKEGLKQRFLQTAQIMWGRELKDLTSHEIYESIAALVKQDITENWIKTNKSYVKRRDKQVYYFSIEFLLGRLMKSNIVNLGEMDLFRDALEELGIDLDKFFPEEPDAGIGNGGLGRLAACFIDSMASLGLPGHGCSIRYQYGLFEQKIVDGNQVEIPDNWLGNGFVWEYRKADKAINVRFNGNAYMKKHDDGSLEAVHEDYMTVMAVPYDVPIVGYKNNTVNNLRLWNAEVNRDFSDYATLTYEQLQEKKNYRNFVESITQYLYPDDSSYEGRRMRLIQEYFFVSAGVQSIVRHFKLTGMDLRKFNEKIAIHINDTHPAVAVAELMRILVDEEGFAWEEAWAITRKTMAYTNHTIMPEALEKWPVDMFRTLLPRIYMIIDEINRRHVAEVRKRYPNDEHMVRELSIIEGDQVHMARLAIVGSHSVNGVAAIHTDILKKDTLKYFHQFYPGVFNNKTNGITHRRWLIASNPELSELIDETIGEEWQKAPSRLTELNDYVKDAAFLDQIDKIKRLRKKDLADFILEKQNIKVDPDTIFDIQVKRIHSYKRQIMNILQVMYLYTMMKGDKAFKIPPTTRFFGGKAAPGYYIAKETIRLINAVAKKVNNDKAIADCLKVVFIENFGVSIGELVYPAADISEQISTASKEASGTGNMKFMMNGAITLGTLDGANVEIREAVGQEHCEIFGLRAEEVMNYYQTGAYRAWDEFNMNPAVRLVMTQLIDGTYGSDFHSLYDYLIHGNDEFFVLKDFSAYDAAHRNVNKKYADKNAWLTTSAINIANSGVFSSDRTIQEYADDIWGVKEVLIP